MNINKRRFEGGARAAVFVALISGVSIVKTADSFANSIVKESSGKESSSRLFQPLRMPLSVAIHQIGTEAMALPQGDEQAAKAFIEGLAQTALRSDVTLTSPEAMPVLAAQAVLKAAANPRTYAMAQARQLVSQTHLPGSAEAAVEALQRLGEQCPSIGPLIQAQAELIEELNYPNLQRALGRLFEAEDRQGADLDLPRDAVATMMKSHEEIRNSAGGAQGTAEIEAIMLRAGQRPLAVAFRHPLAPSELSVLVNNVPAPVGSVRVQPHGRDGAIMLVYLLENYSPGFLKINLIFGHDTPLTRIVADGLGFEPNLLDSLWAKNIAKTARRFSLEWTDDPAE